MGRQQDNVQAFFWFDKGTKQGFSIVQARLGYMYYRGLGIRQSDNLALVKQLSKDLPMPNSNWAICI